MSKMYISVTFIEWIQHVLLDNVSAIIILAIFIIIYHYVFLGQCLSHCYTVFVMCI